MAYKGKKSKRIPKTTPPNSVALKYFTNHWLTTCSSPLRAHKVRHLPNLLNEKIVFVSDKRPWFEYEYERINKINSIQFNLFVVFFSIIFLGFTWRSLYLNIKQKKLTQNTVNPSSLLFEFFKLHRYVKNHMVLFSLF